MKKIILMISLVVIGLFLISCTEPAVCGNNIIESGESCDNSECASGQVCENCACNTLPQPPALPEE